MFKKMLFTAFLAAASVNVAHAWTNTGSYSSGNYYYWWADWSIGGNNYASGDLSCPASYPRIISGNCGHRDYNSAQKDITVNYSGTAPGAGTSSWRCSVENSNGSSRATRWGVVCGK